MSGNEFSKTCRLRFNCGDAEYPKDAAARIPGGLPPVDLYAVPAGGCAGDSDPGRVRSQNEDSFLICTRPDGLFTFAAVADGVGGRMAGEVASRLCLTTLFEEWDRLNREGIFDTMTLTAIPEFLSETVQRANENVFRAAASQPLENRMCTTVAALFLAQKKAFTVHLGDSRIYRVRNGEIMQLTHDHSLVDEMVAKGKLTKDDPFYAANKNVITRAMGISAKVEPDYFRVPLQAGCRLLLCSDGLSGMVDDEAMTAVLAGIADTQQAAEKLMLSAKENGGKDNITVILIDLEEEDLTANLF